MKPIQLLLGVMVFALSAHSSAKNFSVDIAQDFGDGKFRVAIDAPVDAEVTPVTNFKETQVKWKNTTLVLNVKDGAVNTNMPGAKQIRSSDVGGRKLQVFQAPGNAFSFTLSLRSSTVKGFYLSCANTFSLGSLEQVNEAVKVCDSAKIVKKL